MEDDGGDSDVPNGVGVAVEDEDEAGCGVRTVNALRSEMAFFISSSRSDDALDTRDSGYTFVVVDEEVAVEAAAAAMSGLELLDSFRNEDARLSTESFLRTSLGSGLERTYQN